MPERKIKLNMFHLQDGTILLGDKKIEYSDRYIITNPLVLQKYDLASSDDMLKIFLMKYDNFNIDDSITVSAAAVMTHYSVGGDILEYYKTFISESNDIGESVEPAPALLTETITPAPSNTVDLSQFRKNNIKIVVDNEDENN